MIGILIVTLTALVLSIIIVFLDSKLAINNKEQNFIDLLPGYNCGACGFGSCSGMAKKMCENINNYKKCRPLKGDKLKKMEDYVSKYNL